MQKWLKYVPEWREKKGFYTPDSMETECKHDNCVPITYEYDFDVYWCNDCGAISSPDEFKKWNLPRNPSSNGDCLLGKLMLVVSELAEAAEAVRLQDKENFEEEIADTFIRLFDICGSMGFDVEKEISKKMKINEGRPTRHGKKTKL